MERPRLRAWKHAQHRPRSQTPRGGRNGTPAAQGMETFHGRRADAGVPGRNGTPAAQGMETPVVPQMRSKVGMSQWNARGSGHGNIDSQNWELDELVSQWNARGSGHGNSNGALLDFGSLESQWNARGSGHGNPIPRAVPVGRGSVAMERPRLRAWKPPGRVGTPQPCDVAMERPRLRAWKQCLRLPRLTSSRRRNGTPAAQGMETWAGA